MAFHKKLARALLGFFLRLDLFRKAIIKLIETVLLTKDLPGFKETQVLFLDFVKKTRLHLTITSPKLDVDFSYLSEVKSVANDPRLFDLVQNTSKTMGEILRQEFVLDDNLEDNQNTHTSRHSSDSIFLKVPELRNSNNHYLFLYALALSTVSKKIVEIGTASGASLSAFLSSEHVIKVDTFDLSPLDCNKSWLSPTSRTAVNTYLASQRMRWEQHIANLEDSDVWELYKVVFADSDLIFIDTAHLGKFERLMGQRFVTSMSNKTIFVWDDIRLSSMCEFWDSLEMKKIDVGGLGHYSGTGVSLI